MILGNKNDLEDERVISTEEGENFTRRQGDSVIFMETSAKKNTNIDKVRLRNGRRRLYRQFCVDIWGHGPRSQERQDQIKVSGETKAEGLLLTDVEYQLTDSSLYCVPSQYWM